MRVPGVKPAGDKVVVRASLFVAVGILFVVSACASNRQALATATPINLTRSDPRDAKVPPPQACTVVTQKDMADLFAAEVNQPISSPVNHVGQVIFPTTQVSADESYCVYMAFHQSGSKNGIFCQITYWIDTPNQATPEEWTEVWTKGESSAAQKILGIGDAAFYNNGRLTFKKGSTYITIEAMGTGVDSTDAGVNRQIELEKEVALKALKRMSS